MMAGREAIAGAERAWPERGGGFADVAGATRNVVPFLSLGALGLGGAATIRGSQQLAEQTNIAGRAQKLQEQTARSTAEAAAPLTQFGTHQLQLAEAGQLPPAIQAQIDQWVAGALQKARDYAARSGQGDSMMLASWEDWIIQQGKAIGATFLQEQERLGITGLQAGAGALASAGGAAGGVSQTAGAESQAITALMSQANQALATLSAGAA